MQHIRLKPKPQPQPKPKLQAESRSNPHRHDYNPASVRIRLKPESTSENRKPKAILTHGIYEDGRRCVFYVHADGNEVTKNGDPIVCDDDYFDSDCQGDTAANAVITERRLTKKLQAAELLRKALKNGPMPVTKIKERALAADISWSTIDKARYELGLIAAKGTGRCGGWFWLLPK